MKKYAFFVFLVCVVTAMPTRAAIERNMTGAELHTMCTSASNLDYGFCAGYVTAVADALHGASVAGYRACGHDGTRSQQLIDTYNAFADMFPGNLQDSADAAVAASLARAFPCR